MEELPRRPQLPLIFKSLIQGTSKNSSFEILQAPENDGKLPQRFSLARREGSVTTEGGSQIVFIIINVVRTSQIRNHRILTDTV